MADIGRTASRAPSERDWYRGVHPVDAIIERLKREYLERRNQRYAENPYPSQEFVTVLNTGRAMSPEAWNQNQARDAILKAQTDALADALDRTGVQVRGPDNVSAIGLITGQIESLDRYRPICFLPVIAQRDRKPMLNELRLYRDQAGQEGGFMRMGVITSGKPVPVGGMPPADIDQLPLKDRVGGYFECRDRIKEMGRRVSRLADWARDKYDIDVVFRGTEFTVKTRKGDAEPSVHIHCNLLYRPTRYLKKREWREFLDEVPNHIDGAWWKDCGVLKDPNEAIKYAFKPAELDGLTDAQVRWLYEQTLNLKMTQPMGGFQTWRNQTLWRTEKREDGSTVKRKHRKVVTLEYATGARTLSLMSVRKRTCQVGRREPKSIRADDAPPAENVLMTTTTPQRRFSPYAEPCALVMNYTASPTTEWGEETLANLARCQKELRPIWDMNGAPAPEVALAVGRGQAAAQAGEAGRIAAFSVHTRSSTAERRVASEQDHGPPIRASMGPTTELKCPTASAAS